MKLKEKMPSNNNKMLKLVHGEGNEDAGFCMD
jgi:hypothetical protein